MSEDEPLTLESLQRSIGELEALKADADVTISIQPNRMQLQMPVIFTPYALQTPTYVPGIGIIATDEATLQAYFDSLR